MHYYKTRQLFLYIAICFFAFLLSACGGSSGGGGEKATVTPVAPTAPIAITSTNSNVVADEVFDSTSTGAGGIDSVFGADVNQDNSKKTVNKITRLITGLYKKRLTSPQIITGIQINCPNGGTATFPDSADGTGTSSYNDCDLGGIVFNGSTTFSGSGTPDGLSFSGSISFNNFSATGGGGSFVIRGGFDINWSTTGDEFTGTESGTISGTLLQIEFGGETVDLTNFSESYTEDFGTLEETIDSTYTVNSTLLNGSVTAGTEQTLKYRNYEDFFYEGIAVCIGLNGSRVRVTAQGSGLPTGMVFVETDADGDGIYETNTTMTWAAFDLASD